MNFKSYDISTVLSQVQLLANKNKYSQKQQNELISKVIENLRNKQQIISKVKENQNDSTQNTLAYNIPLTQNHNISYVKNELVDQKEFSDTISLSLISDKMDQLNIQDYLFWFEDFIQFGQLFQPISAYLNFLKTCRFDSILNNDFKNIIYSGYDTKLYTGFNLIKKDWIVVKQQIVTKQLLLNSAQQFIIHDYIYQLYPDSFVQLVQPVYIEAFPELDRFKFISQLEYGEQNLYDYSQQNQIKDMEYQLIFQQIYQQINLLHKHSIAHRDIKPQNIIFVQDKGWALCDFGDSIKYQSCYDIYDIKGTYAFLPAKIQQKSTIQGIQLKQNLYENDIYALAITLLVIKYQIKHQNEIQQYIIKTEDQIIQSLINNPHKNHDNLFIKHEQQFIKTVFLSNNKYLNVTDIGLEETSSFIQILQHFELFDKLNQDFKINIIKLIDYALEQRDQNFIDITMRCYVNITKYIKDFKHIEKYSKIRQSNYWKQLYKKYNSYRTQIQRIQCIEIIYYMDCLGLTDITLYYARQFLQNDYEFLVHLMMINILLRLQQFDLVEQEYNSILLCKDMKQMNCVEFDYFTNLTLTLKLNQLCHEDAKYIQQTTELQYFDVDPSQFTQQQYQDLEFQENLIKRLNEYFNRSTQKSEIANHLFIYIDYLYVNIDIYSTLHFIGLIRKYIKYSCPTCVWSKLIQQETKILKELEMKKIQIKQNVKEINYVLIFNSESKMQYALIKIIKLSIFCYQGIRTLNKYHRVQKQINDIIYNLDSINVHFYKIMILREFLNLNYFLLESNQEAYIGYSFKQNIISFLSVDDKSTLIMMIVGFFITTLNYRRCNLLHKQREKRLQIKNSCINQSLQNDYHVLLSLKQFESLQKWFQFSQYVYRT